MERRRKSLGKSKSKHLLFRSKSMKYDPAKIMK